MIEGVEILNQTMIIKSPTWFLFTVSILIGLVLICFMESGKSKLPIFIALLLVLALLIMLSINPKEITGRYRYEAAVDESVSFTEMYERYDVVEQRGQIWILEDKETK